MLLNLSGAHVPFFTRNLLILNDEVKWVQCELTSFISADR